MLVRKSEGKRPLGRRRCRWDCTCKVVRPLDWLRIGQFVGCCEHGNEHLGSIECLECIYYLGNC